MKSLFAIIFTIVLVFGVIECQFGGIFPGPPGGGFGGGFGGGHRRPGNGHRHNDFSLPAITKKITQMEGYVEKYLDKAIGAGKARNSSDVQVLQDIRNNDVPKFFDSIKQKLNAAQNSTSTADGVVNPPVIETNV